MHTDEAHVKKWNEEEMKRIQAFIRKNIFRTEQEKITAIKRDDSRKKKRKSQRAARKVNRGK